MLNKELETALIAAQAASKAILSIYKTENFDIEIKDDNSPVTKADKASDEIIRKILTEAFPLYGILTEESVDDKSRLDKDYVWIVDPIDGTKDFINKNDEFAVSIGLSYKHEAVLGVIMVPATGEIYYAIKGEGSFYLKDKSATPIRNKVSNKTDNLLCLCSRFHNKDKDKDAIERHKDRISSQLPVGACIKGCLIARGLAEIHYRFGDGTKEWDTCAMQVIIEEAGGYLLKFNGEPIRYNRDDVYNRGGYIIINNKENYLK